MKFNKINVLAPIALAFLAAVLGNPLLALAQDAGGVAVHPSTESILIAPGNKEKKSLLIVNSTNRGVTLKVSVSDFKVTDDKGKVAFYQEAENYSAKNWIVPQYEIISIPSLSSKKMEYVVAPGKDLPGKGYGGAIVFQFYDPATKKTSGESFGTLVMLNVLVKGISTGGTISSFTSPVMQFKNPIDFGFTIKNSGNSNLAVSGDVVFTSIFGKEVNRFKSGTLNVYPGASRNFQFQWSDSPIFGAYLGSVNLVDGLRKDNIISGWTLLIFLPWQKLLVVAFSCILLGGLALVIYRRYAPKAPISLLGFGQKIFLGVKHSALAFITAIISLKKRLLSRP